MTPLGGPASGLWPSGGASALPGAGGVVIPSCIPATLFADCFADCSGVISSAAPGPVCGWTFSDAFGVLGGTITFSPGSMSFDTTNPAEFPGDTKPLPAPLFTINGLTGQFAFTEYQTPPNALTTYDLLITNNDLSQGIVVGLFGDGNLLIQLGDPAAAANYFGTWTPNNGSHVVHFVVDELGIPTLFIDGAAVPLTFSGTGASFAAFLPPNVVSFFFGSADVAPGTSPVRNLFLTSGMLPPSTRFCCP